MTIRQLKEILNASPFEPFTIRTADGRAYYVPHREFVWNPPKSQRTIWVANEDGKTAALLDLLLVTALEVGDQGTNGEGQRVD